MIDITKNRFMCVLSWDLGFVCGFVVFGLAIMSLEDLGLLQNSSKQISRAQ